MNAHAPNPLTIRPEAFRAPESGIVEVFTYGRTRTDLIPLWVGEGDLATPEFIRQAAARSLEAGETFYTWQRGIPELRQAIARYHERLFGGTRDPERFFVTIGGMHAAQTAIRMVAGTGDEVIIPTPSWPNFVGAITVAGAEPVEVPLDFDPETGWHLDLDRIKAALTPRTKAICVNTPANPTGWTATLDNLRDLLALARQRGLWIVADEIYGRFVYDGATRAPSFHEVAEPEDRVFYVQTMSKNWAMTGWRVGWLEAPAALGQTIENLIQYSSSGGPVFTQRGARAALDEGEGFVAEQVARAAEGRRIVRDGLLATGRVVLPPPTGAFYAFFRVEGADDSRAVALDIVQRTGIGLAPGSAFGTGGQGFLRLCYARSAGDLHEAVRRMQGVLAS